MKRLLLLLPLLMAPAAQAVDYLKCEAINQAYDRVSVARRNVTPDVADANRSLQHQEFCGGPQEKTYWDYLKCDDGRVFKIDNQRMLAAIEEAKVALDARLKKIKADYEAEGCY